MIVLENYINGELVEPVHQTYIDNIDPSSGAVFSQIPRSNETDVEKAYQAANEAFPIWSGLSVEKRHDYLTAIAHEIKADLENFAKAESLDNGKPVNLAREIDIPRAASNFEFFANAATQFSSESHETNQDAINYTLRRTHRRGRLYFPLEFTPLFVLLENCSCSRRRKYGSGKTLRNNALYCLFTL